VRPRAEAEESVDDVMDERLEMLDSAVCALVSAKQSDFMASVRAHASRK
jgi:hypothetical protein